MKNKQITIPNDTLKRYNEASMRVYKEYLNLPIEIKMKMPSGLVQDLMIVSGTAEYLEEDRLIQEAIDD